MSLLDTIRSPADVERLRLFEPTDEVAFVTDAMLARLAGQDYTIAITNGGGLRASIGAGTATMGDVLTVLPGGSNTLPHRVYSMVHTSRDSIIAASDEKADTLAMGDTARAEWRTRNRTMGVPYWGRYVYHDNNRDGIQVSQARLRQAATKLVVQHPREGSSASLAIGTAAAALTTAC